MAQAVFHVELCSVGGELLASVAGVLGAQRAADLVAHLPEALPGHEYKLLHGDDVLPAEDGLAGHLPPQGQGRAVRITAVMTKGPDAQQQMDVALISAAERLDVERASRLLEAGANPAHLQNVSGYMYLRSEGALHAAVGALPWGHRGEPPEQWAGMVELLLGARANPNALREVSDESFTERESAFEMALRVALWCPRVLESFLAAGADPNMRIEYKRGWMMRGEFAYSSVLHRAVEQRAAGAARALLQAKADASLRAFDKIWAFDARSFRHRYGSGRGDVRFEGRACLHVASSAGDLPMAALLLESRADVNAVRKELAGAALGAPDVAKEQEPEDLREVQETALHIASSTGDLQMVALLVESRADVNAVREKLAGALGAPEAAGGRRHAAGGRRHAAGGRRRDEERGPEYPKEDLRETALHIAILGGHAGVLALLVRAGADTAAVRRQGEKRQGAAELCGGDAGLLAALRASGGVAEGL